MIFPDELSDIAGAIPLAILDIRYATTNNFTGTQLYQQQYAWLRHEPLQQLAQAAEELHAEGFALVIYDAFRPIAVQERLRAVVDDGNYVAEVSNHCRGITIDITLADTNGVYLDMGTEYDDFSEKAHANTNLITLDQQRNRRLLKDSLESWGFVQHPYEWWHFDYQPEKEWSLIPDSINVFK